jgi:hypothetical protein
MGAAQIWKLLHILNVYGPEIPRSLVREVGFDCDPDTLHPLVSSGFAAERGRVAASPLRPSAICVRGGDRPRRPRAAASPCVRNRGGGVRRTESTGSFWVLALYDFRRLQ